MGHQVMGLKSAKVRGGGYQGMGEGGGAKVREGVGGANVWGEGVPRYGGGGGGEWAKNKITRHCLNFFLFVENI